MSGIECAGVVLAVLPLVVESVKAYTRGVNTIKDVLLPRHHDEKLQEFYEDLWWEMHILSNQIRIVLDSSSGLSDKEKEELEKSLQSDNPNIQSVATQAFRDFFVSEDDFQAFMQLIDKVARLLSRLIDSGYMNVRASEMSEGQLLKKLKTFIKGREEKKTSSTLKERLDLRMKEKDLQIRVANLQKWNSRLGKLIKQSERRHASPVSTHKQKTVHTKRPSIELSLMPQILFDGLQQCWECSCKERHQAQLCLRLPHRLHRGLDPAGIDFELFLSVPTITPETQGAWGECTVHVRKDLCATLDTTVQSKVKIQPTSNAVTEGTKITRVCEAVTKVHTLGHRLCLLAEDGGSKFEMWRIRSQKRQLPPQDTTTAVPLSQTLVDLKSLPLTQKRELALVLAYSLVLLDGTHWMEERWTKREVSFFHDPTKRLDYGRPYVSSFIEPKTKAKPTLNLDILHPNLSILSLGILLIEIETGTPIEQHRLPEDLSNGVENDNTDYTVADRLSKALSNCTPDYQEAIFACLDVPWRTAGKQVTLDDPETRSAVYENIISHLESEVESLGIDLTVA